jgi:hypothetical protein
MVRGVALLVGLLAAVPAVAGEMSADEARRFVIGKLFSYTCFEGTRGQGRVHADGSVVGSVQFRGEGQVRYAALPAGTLQVRGESVCASLRGLPIQPCFNLEARCRAWASPTASSPAIRAARMSSTARTASMARSAYGRR